VQTLNETISHFVPVEKIRIRRTTKKNMLKLKTKRKDVNFDKESKRITSDLYRGYPIYSVYKSTVP